MNRGFLLVQMRLFAVLVIIVVATFGQMTKLHAVDIAKEKGSKLLHDAIEAHGGLKKFQSYGTFTYHTDGLPYSAAAPLHFDQTTDLVARRHRMEGTSAKGSFVSGSNDTQGWTTSSEILGIPPRWVNHGNSYFVLMPFIFADPGITVRHVGDREYGGQVFDAVAVSYNKGVGDTAEDDYILYLDKETKCLRLIDFSVTYGPMRGDTAIEDLPRRSLEFKKWVDVDGLMVPEILHYAPWEQTSTGGKRKDAGVQYMISNIDFKRERPSPSLFEAPQGAEIEGEDF
ncbi:hypothetical protein [Poriferisphaera sp. WC338]|uniref:hypothetical protein n=1 Tax=Poriferisphaera sp. WC338 TaxID=3425129 RepID=UPI003D81A698